MQTDFVNQMWPHARRVAASTGIDPRLVIAQSALETGWGQHAPGNNYFGIKSHGQSGGNTMATTEVINGSPVSINDSFRGYADMGASADDYGRFLLENPRYGAVLNADGIDAQIAAMGASGYATDPNYAAKLAEIINNMPQSEGAAIGAATMSALGQSSPSRGLLAETSSGVPAMPANPTQGLLSHVSAMNAPQQARPSFWDNVPGLSDPDRRARLAIGLEGLALNPNQGWMQNLQGGIDTRAKDRHMNQTAEWLRGQPGGEQFAAALEAGADPQGVFNAYLQTQQPQSPMDLAQLEQVQLQNARLRNENMALPGSDVGVRASEILADGTLIQSTDSGPRVFSPSGVELTGEAAAAAVRAGRDYDVANQTQIYGGRREGTLGADITMGGDAAAVIAQGTASGQLEGQRAGAAPLQIQNADIALQGIDAVLSDPAMTSGTGASSWFSVIPGTPGYGFQARVDQLKGGAFLTAIQQLQGMGALSNAEGATATAAIARLDTAQSQEDFVRALQDYRQIVETGKARATQNLGGGDAPRATAIRRFNPETGQLE